MTELSAKETIHGNPWSKWIGIDIFVGAVLVGGAYRATLPFVVVRSPKSGYYSRAGFSTLNRGKLSFHFTESDKRKNRLAPSDN
jgi:hypothetical protein